MSRRAPSHCGVLSTSTTETPIPGRRSRKRTKERTEEVWPPVLESALLDALDKYRPTNNLRYQRDTRSLLRFPKRNRFISDYIFSVTGTRRTAKQVGSRLQQTRESCNDERILGLISRREYSLEPDMDFTVDANTPSASSTPFELPSAGPSPVSSASDFNDIEMDTGIPSPERLPSTFVTIELVPPSGSALRSHEQRPAAIKSPTTNQQSLLLEYPSDIENNNPILTFSTPREISTSRHYSHFRLFLGDILAHSEITRLGFISTSFETSPQRHTYSTNLIPLFWAHLCRTAQLFECIIIQDIMKTLAPFDDLPASPSANDQSIRSVTYEFSASRTPEAVFRPPPLVSEPPLPPGFPVARRGPREPTTRPTSKASRSADIASFSHALASSSEQYVQAEDAVYGWSADGSAVALPTDGLFFGTAFHHQDDTQASSWVPQLSSSSFEDDRSIRYLPNQWLDPNGHYYPNPGVPSSMWSASPMYSELNSNSYY
ncbi:hypothetical protein B0H16DRAFT_1504457 [Mycena metata]|uniref:TEA domain-containing protein n=1 Tax=Mycena metata TaxID=1033252 RepID=A0AAD7K2S4_9AGAR|nr:hypothetical protein B0H16DRAFT_1504457 [Mycena metata]